MDGRKSKIGPFWCVAMGMGVNADLPARLGGPVASDGGGGGGACGASETSLCNWCWIETMLSPRVMKWSMVLARSPWHVERADMRTERFCIGKTRSSISTWDISCRRILWRGEIWVPWWSSTTEPEESSFECTPDVLEVVVVPSSALRLVELVGLLPVFGDEPDASDSWSWRGEFDDEAWSPKSINHKSVSFILFFSRWRYNTSHFTPLNTSICLSLSLSLHILLTYSHWRNCVRKWSAAVH